MNGKRVIVTAAAALAAAAIALGLWTLLESRVNTPGQTVLGEGALDMVLIDIEDQDAATHYHVNTLAYMCLRSIRPAKPMRRASGRETAS